MDPDRLNPNAARGDASSVLSDENSAAYRSSNAVKAAESRGTRKLVLCFDGTGNKFHGDDSDSNILKIFRMLDRTADDQYHYYQPGIGTYVTSGSLTHSSTRARLNSWYTKAKDSAIGSSFDHHVVGGYRFLMRFYNPGDEIYMFGFSRGAYIARFLAEMLDYIGLLSHGNEEMVKFAWKAFAQWQCRNQSSSGDSTGQGGDPSTDPANAEKRKMFNFMKGFRETFSRPVGRIRFLGLFDTVNSVPRFETAWMQRSKFPYTARSSAQVIRHAVSIDERRAKFRQDLMYQGNPKSQKHHKHKTRWHAWGKLDGPGGAAAAGGEAARNEKHEHPEKETDEKQNGAHEKPVYGQEQRKSLSAEGPRTNGRASTDRGRDTSRNLNIEAKEKLRSSSRAPDPSGDYAPYRARSASRRRVEEWKGSSHTKLPKTDGDDDDHGKKNRQKKKKKKKKQQQQQQQGGADAMSMSSGVSPSAWEDDAPQDIDEVWFAGGHADVGGGWEMLEDRKSSSHVPLAWIVREAMRAGLPFDPDKVKELGCACSTDWDGSNPAKLHSDIKRQRREERRHGGGEVVNIPDIRLQDGPDATPHTPTFPESPPPMADKTLGHDHKHDSGHEDASDNDDEDDSDDEETLFHGLMHLAHTAPIHDSLEYGQGLGIIAVTAWKVMEYMPFVRMDLKSNGSWEPIRWPLPRGEVRDIPDNVRVHGSVIRRMKNDVNYRPGNLIIGGGGRGVRKAPEKHGIGDWTCVAEEGDPIGEIWMRKSKPENSS